MRAEFLLLALMFFSGAALAEECSYAKRNHDRYASICAAHDGCREKDHMDRALADACGEDALTRKTGGTTGPPGIFAARSPESPVAKELCRQVKSQLLEQELSCARWDDCSPAKSAYKFEMIQIARTRTQKLCGDTPTYAKELAAEIRCSDLSSVKRRLCEAIDKCQYDANDWRPPNMYFFACDGDGAGRMCGLWTDFQPIFLPDMDRSAKFEGAVAKQSCASGANGVESPKEDGDPKCAALRDFQASELPRMLERHEKALAAFNESLAEIRKLKMEADDPGFWMTEAGAATAIIGRIGEKIADTLFGLCAFGPESACSRIGVFYGAAKSAAPCFNSAIYDDRFDTKSCVSGALWGAGVAATGSKFAGKIGAMKHVQDMKLVEAFEYVKSEYEFAENLADASGWRKARDAFREAASRLEGELMRTQAKIAAREIAIAELKAMSYDIDRKCAEAQPLGSVELRRD
jgi:hypothetical protein